MDAATIEQTNKLRLSLGLPALPTGAPPSGLSFKDHSSSESSDEEPASTLETREAAGYGNWKQLQDEADAKKRRAATAAAIKKARDLAARDSNLTGRGLGDVELGNDVSAKEWLKGSKKRQKQIEKERARRMEEELAERERLAAVEYGSQDLVGVKVGHEVGEFEEEDGEQVLTLKDTTIDENEEEGDELENLNMREREKLKEKMESKKRRPIYDPNAVDDSTERKVLAQYDEEIDGRKRKRFTLGDTLDDGEAKKHHIGEALRSQPISLDLLRDEPKSDYMDISEIKIKKTKKSKKSTRQKAAEDDDILIPTEYTNGLHASSNSMDVEEAKTKTTTFDTSFADDDDLQAVLAAQRRSAFKKRKRQRPEDIARQLQEEASGTPVEAAMDTAADEEEPGLVIDETATFVGTLSRETILRPEVKKPVTTTAAAEESEEDDHQMDVDAKEIEQERVIGRTEEKLGTPDITATGLEEEVTLDNGLGATMNMLRSRNIIKSEDAGDANALLRSRGRFKLERDRLLAEFDQRARQKRERERNDPKFMKMSQKEKDEYARWENSQRELVVSKQLNELFQRDYVPNVKLSYVDEFGRSLNQKEAFKELSHQFHGKGSGKQKIEKHLKKIEDEKKREAASALDSSRATGMNNAMGTTAILYVRKSAFERRIGSLAEERQKKQRLRRSISFTLSSSKKRSANGREQEDAVASGVVRGRAIKSPGHDFKKSESYELHDQSARKLHQRLGSDSSLPSSKVSMPAEGLASDTDEREDGESRGRSKAKSDAHNDRIRFGDQPHPIRPEMGDLGSSTSPLKRSHTKLFSGSGVGARHLDNHPRNAHPTALPLHTPQPPTSELEAIGHRHAPLAAIDKYVKTLDGYIGRNSQFHNLSEKERRRLGGVEYDAICVLSYIVPLYFVLWQLLGAVGVGAWIQINRPSIALTNGLGPFWTGAFFAISAFNNSGMALLDANAVALQTSYYCLLTLGLLILAGNTCFPPFLRLIIWTMKKALSKTSLSPRWQKRRKVLTFILDHPRRVYTHMFPSQQTWWLVFSLFVLNGIDWVAFEVLNIGNPVTEAIPPHFRALNGLFQAFAIRSGGFYVVPIAGLRSGLLVLYVLMMYVSALPVTMTMRNTNVYEERSLGIYSEDLPAYADAQVESQPRNVVGSLKRRLTSNQSPRPTWSRSDFIRQQLRGQLGHDLWWIALAVLFITMIETGQFGRDPVVFATFNIIFEVVSAYGTVGVSTGVPWNNYSFCGAWHTGSKLILCAVMLRGRHRGLPVAIDKAILLPDETLAWAEEEDAQRRSLSRRRTPLDLEQPPQIV